MDHKLFIRQASLSATASDRKRSVVEATCINKADGTTFSYTIFSLKLGFIEAINLKLNFATPVTLKLVSGSGPIHLVGYQRAIVGYENLKEGSTDSEDTVIEDAFMESRRNFEAAPIHTEMQNFTSISDASSKEKVENDDIQDISESEEFVKMLKGAWEWVFNARK
ncbi:hypothetical protein MXB_1167 [Myxobolus squamalis]|nr:hypothetical protein MXB_1167 [Myxobolus squamalis]